MTVRTKTTARALLVAWRNAVFVIFGINGLAMASWVARTPAIRDQLSVSTTGMGLLIFGLSSGAIIGLLTSSRVLQRFGAKATVLGTMIAVALGTATVGFGAAVLGSFAVAFIGLTVLGAFAGICDVAMNVEGAAVERALGRNIMPIFHAFFSFGTIAGAGVGALASFAGVPIHVHFTTVAVILIVGTVFSVRSFQPHRVEPATDATAAPSPAGLRGRLSTWLEPRTLLIGLIVLGMAFAEGSANDWLTLAVVDDRGVDNAMGAVLFGVFTVAMTAGRIGGVPMLDRFGRVPVLRASAVLAAAGLLVLIFLPHPVLMVTGIVMWGLGSSLGFPVGMSAAADDPAKAAVRVSAVAIVGYCAFLVGPPLIGLLGDHFGLLNALLVVVVLIALAGFVSHAARRPEPAVE